MTKHLSLLFFLACSLELFAQSFNVKSPDNRLKLEVSITDGIVVSLFREGTPAVTIQNLSLNAEKGLQVSYNVISSEKRSVQEKIKPVIREKQAELDNIYNELNLQFRNNSGLTFRLFNEGLAYRWTLSLPDSLTIKSESISVNFESGDSIWFQPSGSFNSSYETPYEHRPVSGLKKGELCHLPLLVQKNNRLMILVTESDLYNFPGLWMKGTASGTLEATHPAYPKKLRYTGSVYEYGQVAETYDYIAKINGTRTLPWRIFAVAGNEVELVANNMVYLLASPNVLDDVSWIKPGVVMFDWWAKHNIYGVKFKSGVNTETAKYFIDFCAANGFRYFLFDDGWSPEDDVLHTVDGLNMEEVTAYAKTKGVDVMVWVIWQTLEKQWQEAFDLFEKWGIKGIKMDFMNRDDQRMVEFYEAFAKKAAEKKMVVNYHGAYKPCGLRRKYPNILTREALIEFEYNGWTAEANPVHHNLLPYIRGFTGPMDYIPATLRNSTKDNFRAVGDYPMGQGTRAHSMALFVILNSPMTMLPDSPSDYQREAECTRFLSNIPVEWDETVLKDGKIAGYTIMARRSGDEWFIGAITNWQPRNLNLGTGFLKPGKYRLEAIADGINANKRAEDYIIITKEFTAGDTLDLHLAPGGGWVARLVPVF